MNLLSASPAPTLAHLERLTDHNGIVEHALRGEPRADASYCTDDAGRLLALVSHMDDHPSSQTLALSALGFLERAYRGDATFRLRCDARGRWSNDVSDDATGRALLGLAHAATYAAWPVVQRRSRELFTRAVNFRSDYIRAAAYATLAATVLLRSTPDHHGAQRLIEESPDFVVPHDNANPAWPWIEKRLTYANALLPLAELARAAVRQDRVAGANALSTLKWLCEEETLEDHFSFTPVGGRGPNERAPQFDQQPIEAWATTEACVFAYEYSKDASWLHLARRAGSWFLSNNDVGVLVYDPTSGGGYDGLERTGVNLNQGAESTLSFVATMRELEALDRLGASPQRLGNAVLQATSRSASSR